MFPVDISYLEVREIALNELRLRTFEEAQQTDNDPRVVGAIDMLIMDRIDIANQYLEDPLKLTIGDDYIHGTDDTNLSLRLTKAEDWIERGAYWIEARIRDADPERYPAEDFRTLKVQGTDMVVEETVTFLSIGMRVNMQKYPRTGIFSTFVAQRNELQSRYSEYIRSN